MTNHTEVQDQAENRRDEIVAHVLRYNPQRLSEGQRNTMLDDIRIAVLKAEPTTKYVAGNMLSAVSTFIAQSTPPEGARFAESFTEDRVATWISASLQRGASKHTLSSRRGLLARVIRSFNGLPATIHGVRARGIAAAPIGKAPFDELRLACAAASEQALRAFTAVFGTGLNDTQCLGGIFASTSTGMSLVLVTGEEVPVANGVGDLAGIAGATVLDGDWREVRAIANRLNIFVDHRAIKQTYRSLAVLEPEPLTTLMARYRLSEVALNEVAPYLHSLVQRDETDVAAILRGELPAQRADVLASPPVGGRYVASARRTTRRHVDRDVPTGSNHSGGVAVVKRVSRSEAQRLAKQFREQAMDFPPIPDSVRDFIDKSTAPARRMTIGRDSEHSPRVWRRTSARRCRASATTRCDRATPRWRRRRSGASRWVSRGQRPAVVCAPSWV